MAAPACWLCSHNLEESTADFYFGTRERIIKNGRPLVKFSSSLSLSWPLEAERILKNVQDGSIVCVHTSGRIEDQSSKAVEVYFAGKIFGGNALGSGTFEEEIRFMLSPELIAGMLFLPAMADNEAIEIVGAEWFSTYRRYNSSFRHSDAHVDETDTDTLGRRRKTRIVAVNELCIPEMREYTADIFLREINKSFCGFLYHGMDLDNNIGVATGDMVSKEDPATKAIIHWLAASQAQRPFIAYFTYGYYRLQNLDKVVDWISSHTSTVGDLWNMLIEYSKGETNVGFFQWLQLSKEKPII